MGYQWSLDTSECDSRFGDFTSSSWFHTTDRKDFPDPESRPFVTPSVSLTHHRAPIRPFLPPSVPGNIDDFGAFLISSGVRLDGQPSTQASSPAAELAPLRRVRVSSRPAIVAQPVRPLRRVRVSHELRFPLQRILAPCVGPQQHEGVFPALPSISAPLSPTFASSVASPAYTSSPAPAPALSPVSPTFTPAAPLSPSTIRSPPPNVNGPYFAYGAAHLAAVPKAELRYAQPAAHSPRWPRIRDPDHLIRTLHRGTLRSPSPARDPLEQLDAYFSRRRAIRLSLATGLCPIESSDEKAPAAVPELIAGLHPVDLLVAPAELPATLDNHFDVESAFVAEADPSPVCELDAPTAAKSGFLSRVKLAVRSGLLWLAKLFD